MQPPSRLPQLQTRSRRNRQILPLLRLRTRQANGSSHHPESGDGRRLMMALSTGMYPSGNPAFFQIAAASDCGYDVEAMTRIDWGKERQRLTEHYAAMADGELQKIAAQFSSLTSMAQETLRTEMNSRGIQLTPAESANSRDNGAADKSVPVLIAQYLS